MGRAEDDNGNVNQNNNKDPDKEESDSSTDKQNEEPTRDGEERVAGTIVGKEKGERN